MAYTQAQLDELDKAGRHGGKYKQNGKGPEAVSGSQLGRAHRFRR